MKTNLNIPIEGKGYTGQITISSDVITDKLPDEPTTQQMTLFKEWLQALLTSHLNTGMRSINGETLRGVIDPEFAAYLDDPGSPIDLYNGWRFGGQKSAEDHPEPLKPLLPERG